MNNIFFDRAEIEGNDVNEGNAESVLSTPVEDVNSHVSIEIWTIEPSINIPSISIG
jgi:hypothetical protein